MADERYDWDIVIRAHLKGTCSFYLAPGGQLTDRLNDARPFRGAYAMEDANEASRTMKDTLCPATHYTLTVMTREEADRF